MNNTGPQIAKEILEEIQKAAVNQISEGKWEGKELGHEDKNGQKCDGRDWSRAGCKERTIKGRLGHKTGFSLQQMKCGKCGRHIRAILPILGVSKWQRHTDELEKELVERGMQAELSMGYADIGADWRNSCS